MPRNGATDLLRNVVISVGLEFGSKEIGIDARTLTEQSIRLFQPSQPHQLVEAFFIADENTHSLLVEPAHLLAPNTEYIFEITEAFKDLAGNSFGPYQIRFSTGSKSLPKHISTQRPKIVHKTKSQYTPSSTSLASAMAGFPSTEIVQSASKPPAMPKEKSEETENTGQASSSSQIANSPEAKPIQPLISELSTDMLPVKTEEPTKPAPIAETNTREKETEEEEEPKASNEVSFVFPKSMLASNEKLPVAISVPGETQVQYIIKNTKGEIVKKGDAGFKAGFHKKSLPLAGLAPGRYLILIKGGEGRGRHEFEIK